MVSLWLALALQRVTLSAKSSVVVPVSHPPVQAVASDGQEFLYLLAGANPSIEVLNYESRTTGSVGNSSSSETHLSLPVALAVGKGGMVFTLDRRPPRVVAFRRVSDRLQFKGSFELAFSPHGMCVLDDRVYVLGYHNGTLIHAYDFKGSAAGSFASVDSNRSAILRDVLSHGFLACIRAPPLIVFASLYSRNLKAFSVDGSGAWQTTLEGIRPLVIRQGKKGAIQFVVPPDGKYDLPVGVNELAPGLISVQFAEQTLVRRDLSLLDTRIVSSTLGRELARQTDLPLVMWIAHPLLFVLSSADRKAIEVRRFRVKAPR